MSENDRLRITIEDQGGAEERPVTTVTLTEAEFAALKALISPGEQLVRRKQPSWNFIFNVGLDGVIFRDLAIGHTRPEDRVDLREELPILDSIASAAVKSRGGAGRFFGNRSGIYFKSKEKGAEPIPCVRFTITTPRRS